MCIRDSQKAIDEMQDQISIVYTPLHGTGNIPARRVMKELGNVLIVDFPADNLILCLLYTSRCV